MKKAPAEDDALELEGESFLSVFFAFKLFRLSALAFWKFFERGDDSDAHMAKGLTEDEARRIAANIANLPGRLGAEAK